MSTHATGTFEVQTWDEQPYEEIDAERKLTRASITNTFQGDITGDGTLEYLMMYPKDAPVSFVGLQRVVGRVADRSGSFVLQTSGIFGDGKAKGTWFVVPGSGTGDLHNLRGEGNYVSIDERQVSITLDYDVE